MSYPHYPSAHWFDFSEIEAQCEAYREERIVIATGDRLNRTSTLKAAMYLRGTEQIFIDMVEAPDMARALFSRIKQFYLDYNERLFRAANGKIDIFMMGDDFGAQNGLLVSYDMWCEFFRQPLKEYTEQAKRFGMKVMHHSCGAIRQIIPDLIEIGIDILNPLQPGAVGMEPASLKRNFGDRICFHGSIDIQHTLPYGTPEDIRNEVRDRMRALARGGGFIICTAHNIQVDTPIENILTLFDAYKEFGQYPIKWR